MRLMRFAVTGLVMFAIIITLGVTMYNGLEDEYNIVKGDTRLVNGQNVNIADQMKNLNIVAALNQTTTAVVDLRTPTATQFDVLGALASAGVGVLNTITSLFTFPFEIANIILIYYNVPTAVVNGLLVIIVLIISFIMLSAYLQREL